MNAPGGDYGHHQAAQHDQEPGPAEGLEGPAQASQYLRRLRPPEQVEVEGPVVADGRDVVAVAVVELLTPAIVQDGRDRVVIRRGRVHAEPVQVRRRDAWVVDEVVLERAGEPTHSIDIRVVEGGPLHDQRDRLQAAYDRHVVGWLDALPLEGLDGDRDDPDALARRRLGPARDRQEAAGRKTAVVALERLDRVQVVLRHTVRPREHRPEGVGEAHLYYVEALVGAAEVAPRALVRRPSRPACRGRRRHGPRTAPPQPRRPAGSTSPPSRTQPRCAAR